MKSWVAALTALLLVSLTATFCLAAGPRVKLEHSLTGVSKGDTSWTLNYSLHVVNNGKIPLSDLTLSLVPHPPLVRDRVSVEVGTLGPHQERDVPLQIVTPVRVDDKHLSATPLFWKGNCVDPEGNRIEFPAVSKTGGAK